MSDVMQDSENNNNDDLNQLPGYEQEQLTEEEKKEPIYKSLIALNPQAAHNIMQFSFKERKFIRMDESNHIVTHYQIEGDQILMFYEEDKKGGGGQRMETDEFREQ